MAGSKLTVGAVGPEVAWLHEKLSRSGIHVAAPNRNFFGPETQAAVKEFQRSRHLAVTGEVDKATAAVLLAARPDAPLVAAGESLTPEASMSIGPAAAPGVGGVPSRVRPSTQFELSEAARRRLMRRRRW
jgi:peptidoglycan hydrolase-like protein with peptidoglycan-binding domain